MNAEMFTGFCIGLVSGIVYMLIWNVIIGWWVGRSYNKDLL